MQLIESIQIIKDVIWILTYRFRQRKGHIDWLNRMIPLISPYRHCVAVFTVCPGIINICIHYLSVLCCNFMRFSSSKQSHGMIAIVLFFIPYYVSSASEITVTLYGWKSVVASSTFMSAAATPSRLSKVSLTSLIQSNL